MRVSAVVPVHDGAEFLADALRSIAEQSRPVAETIVVDDGSTDDSARIAASFPGVRVLRQARAGPAAARNAGVAASSGELLAFLDADDMWTPDKLVRQVAHLRDHPELGGVYGRERLIVSPGAVPPAWALGPDGSLDGRDGHAPATLVLRREAWHRVGPMDPSLRRAEDIDWLLRAAEVGVRFETLGAVVLLRRLHGANLTHDTAATNRAIALSLKLRLDRRRAEAGA